MSPWKAYAITPDTAVTPIAESDVAGAARVSYADTRSRSGTITIPPPTPNNALKKPATRPMSTSRTAPILRRVDLVARLAEDPAQAAILLDVDGALAPIVPRPEDARVPPETQTELRRLQGRYALVGCVSGRAGDDARRTAAVP